jgi:hypothetical protein
LNWNGFESTGDLIAIDRHVGRELWRFTPPGDKSDFQGGPTISDDIAVVGDTRSHRLRAISLSDHAQLWESEVSDSGYVTAESQPVVHNYTEYAASTDTQIHALDLHTGRPFWRALGRAGSLGSVAVCGRLVLAVPWVTGVLIAVDRVTMKVWRPRVLVKDDELFSRVAVDGNMAYAVGVHGVYAFECAE